MAWLLTWLWQGVAVALVVSVLLRLAHRLNASTRHVIWWTTLGVVVALPAIAALPGRGVETPAAVSPSTQIELAAPLVAPLVIPAVPDWVLSVLIGGWLGFVVVRAMRVARSFASLRQLKRHCRPMPPAQERRLTGWMAVRGGRPRTILALSKAVAMPSALGLGRPVIVLPESLAFDLDDEDLDRIVLHECAHLARRDDWTRLAQAIVECVAGLHPAVWWVGRQIDLEREAACDDFVVSRTGEALRYASSLATAAECAMRAGRRRASVDQALAPGAARAGRTLVQRVTRLVDRRRGRRPWSVAAALGASALVVSASLMVVAPLSAVVRLVDAAQAGTQPPVVLTSRAIAAGVSAPAADAPSRRVALQRDASPAPRAEVPGAPPVRDLVDLAAGAPRALVEALPVDASSSSSSVLPAVPIGERLGDGRPVVLVDVSDNNGAARANARGPWQEVAGAGAAVGSGVKNAGLATAGFFTRAGVTIARAF